MNDFYKLEQILEGLCPKCGNRTTSVGNVQYCHICKQGGKKRNENNENSELTRKQLRKDLNLKGMKKVPYYPKSLRPEKPPTPEERERKKRIYDKYKDFKSKNEQALNEVSPELLDRAARQAYAQGDDHLHYKFKKAALDRKSPGEESWEERFRILYRKLMQISEETKSLMHNKYVNNEQKQRCREFYFELDDLLKTATRFFFK